MIRPGQQKGFILMPVVLAIVLIATLAFLLNNQSTINIDITTAETEARQVDYVATAGLRHATWAAQNSGCAADMSMTTVPFGQAGSDSYSATVTTPSIATSAYSLSADQDAWFRSDNITNNNGGTVTYHLRMESGNLEYVVVRFDLSSLPAGAQINSATARFYVKATKGHPEGPVQVHRVIKDWTETGATWETMATNYDSAIQATVLPQPSAGGVWVDVNLTAQVQAWVNDGEPNYGIMLIPLGEGTHAEYISREGVASQQPRLDVIVGNGVASPMSISATGTLAGNPSPANDISRTLTHNAVPVYQPASEFVLQPGPEGKDGWVDATNKSNNFGTTTEMVITGGANPKHFLIEFKLPAIPYGSRIVSARLEMELNYAGSSTAAAEFSVYRMKQAWTEGTGDYWNPGDGANWNTSDGSTAWNWTSNHNASVVAITRINPTFDGRHSWEIKSLVQQWVSGQQPNYGLLIKGNANAVGAGFASSDWSTASKHPSLSITYACECGSACLAPQGSGNVLMVVEDTANLDTHETTQQALLESWGYQVTTIADNAPQTAFINAFTTHDVVYMTGSAIATDVGTKLTNAPIGVVSNNGGLNDELGIASSKGRPIGTGIDVIDTSHYITAPLASGGLPVYTAAMKGLTATGTLAPGLQTLAQWGTDTTLAVLDQGTTLVGGGTAAARRVILPFGRAEGGNLDWSYVSNNGRLIVQRAIQWGTGNTGIAPVLIYRDEFSNRNCDAADYTGSDGDLDWSPWAWVEDFDDGTSCGGNLEIIEDPVVIEPGNYRLKISNNNRKIARQVDLSAFTQAHLSFDYRPDSMNNNVHVIFEAWDDAGGIWVEVDRISGPLNETVYASTSYDISPYISANAAIRIVTSGLGINEELYIDNLQISETAAASPLPTYNVLMIVGNLTLSSKDVGYKTLMESWGHTVSVIDEGDSQANYDVAMAAADVILASGSALGSSMLDKATFTTKGLVNEVSGKIDNFGFSSVTTATNNFANFATTSPTHYITEPFAGNPVTVFTSALNNPVPGGTLAPDLQIVSLAGSVPALGTLETGATRYDSTPSLGRRVHLPYANAETTDMTADGKTILQRALEWAAGAGSGGGGVGTVPNAHWKLDEVSGLTAVDSVGGHDGTLINGTDWSAGQVDGALNFNGTSDYINVPHANTLSLSDTMTFTAWVNASSYGGSYQTIIAKDASGSGSNYYFGSWQQELVFGFFSGGFFREVFTSGLNLQTGTWYQLAASFDNNANVVILYLDGAPVHKGELTFSPTVVAADLTIGRSPDGEYWPGLLDDVRLYNSVLTAGEIADLYTAGGGGGGSGPSPGGVVFEEFTETKRNSNGTDLVIDKPPGTAAGDLLIAAVATDGNTDTSLAPPAGWNVVNVADHSGRVSFGVWWKLAGAADGSSYTFTWSNKEHAYGWIMRFTGFDPASPIHMTSNSGGTSDSPVSPSVTTTVADTMILRLGGFDASNITTDNPGLPVHTAITADQSGTGAAAVSGGAGYVMQPVAGTSGASNFTLTGSQEARTVTIAITPAP